MFGTVYFGQIYFAGVVFEPPPGPSIDNCGGMFGTATFGQPYFGQHIQCGEIIPPIPPVPPIPPSLRKIGRENPQYRPYSNEAMEEEDLELIIGLWLNLK